MQEFAGLDSDLQAANFIVLFPFLLELSLHIFEDPYVGLDRYRCFLSYLRITASFGGVPCDIDDCVARYWSSALSPWLPKGFIEHFIRWRSANLLVICDYRRPLRRNLGLSSMELPQLFAPFITLLQLFSRVIHHLLLISGWLSIWSHPFDLIINLKFSNVHQE